MQEIYLELKDTEFPFDFIDHDREIVRAIVFDDHRNFYFGRVERNDALCQATLIETAGGGLEAGEALPFAIQRELSEELGVQVDIVCKIGVVSDFYNLVHRHNVNHYFLCKITAFGERQLTKEEKEEHRLSTLVLTYDEAVEYCIKRRKY